MKVLPINLSHTLYLPGRKEVILTDFFKMALCLRGILSVECDT